MTLSSIYTAGKKRYSQYKKCGKMVAADARTLAAAVKPFLPFNAEHKHIDVAGNVNVPNTGSLLGLNFMVQGTDNDERVGRGVRMTHLEIRYTLTLNASATVTRVRCMVVRQKQPMGTIISLSDLLTTVSVNSFPQWDDAKQFDIIRDRTFTLNSDTPERVAKLSYKVPNYKGKVRFNASNFGTIADIETNGYWFIMLADEATNLPNVSYATRFKYLDN